MNKEDTRTQKSIQSLATKLVKKNSNRAIKDYAGTDTKDFFRNTYLVDLSSLNDDTMSKIRNVAEQHGFNVKYEKINYDPKSDNPYMGIQFCFEKNGIQTELQVSCDELYKVKQETEANYKKMGSLSDDDPIKAKCKKENAELYQKLLDGSGLLRSFFIASNDTSLLSSSQSNSKKSLFVSPEQIDQDSQEGISQDAINLSSLQTNNVPLSGSSPTDHLSNNNLSPSLSLKSDISNSSSNDHSISQSDSDFELVKVDDKGDIVDDAIYTQYKKTEIDRNIERNPTSKLVKEASKGKTILYIQECSHFH